MKERIGIVLEAIDEKYMKGYLVDIDILVKLNEKFYIEICKNVKKYAFTLEIDTNIVSLFSNVSFNMGQQIAIELGKIGLKDVKFVYCDELYDADGEQFW